MILQGTECVVILIISICIFLPYIHIALAINYKHLLVASHSKTYGNLWERVSSDNCQTDAYEHSFIKACVLLNQVYSCSEREHLKGFESCMIHGLRAGFFSENSSLFVITKTYKYRTQK